MKEAYGKIQYKGKEYKLVFNLNVMENIQEEYGTLDKWGELTDGSENGEPDAKAVIFGFKEMINEGIDIDNEENGTDIKPLTHKQVGRIISEVGMVEATQAMNETVVESTKDEGKNE
nr:MAG TPA: tail tube protein [Caudoviricetes sp.]